MPSPLGHSLAGFVIHLCAAGKQPRRQWPTLLLLITLANLPDIDFVVGYFIGEHGAYHRGPSHSLIVALLIGIVLGGLIGTRTGRYMAPTVLASAAYASHIVLDMLIGSELSGTFGLQIFWPLSSERFTLPWSVFRMAADSIIATGPITTLFSPAILPLVTRELQIMLPVVLVSWFFWRARIAQRDRADR